jgi:PBP1b-binding outer membrane lipoprotein LpoB
MRPSAIKYIIILAAIILAGCAHMDNSNRDKSLYKTTQNYKNSILWRLTEVADNLRETGKSEEQTRKVEKLKKIKVTNYKAVHRDMTDNGNTAKQTVEIKYYHTDQMVERTLIDKQVWKYDTERKVWHLQSGLPEFK